MMIYTLKVVLDVTQKRREWQWKHLKGFFSKGKTNVVELNRIICSLSGFQFQQRSYLFTI